MNKNESVNRGDYKPCADLEGLTNQIAWSPSGKLVFAASLSSLFMF